MNNTLNINQNLNEYNLRILNRKNKIFINEILPFITDLLKIAFSITNDKIKNNDGFENNIPKFDGDRRTFDTFSKGLFNSFKEQYHLNSDIYNFKDNGVFSDKRFKKQQTNKPRNVVLRELDIYRNKNIFYLEIKFFVRFVFEGKLNEYPIDCEYGFASIAENDKITLNIGIIDDLQSKYNLQKNEEIIKKYQEFLNFQSEIFEKYKNNLEEFEFYTNGYNIENIPHFNY